MLKVLVGDVIERLRELPDESVHCVVTSPPYWGLRDYSADGQIGLEPTPEAHIEKMVEVFREVRRVLRADGTCWVNYGDCYWSQGERRHGGWNGSSYDGGDNPQKCHGNYAGKCERRDDLKPKDLVMMPARVALALQEDGWWLRSEIIWAKPNPMPESCTDRPTSAHEKIYLLAKSSRYFFDAEAVRERWKPESVERVKTGLNARTTRGSGNHSANRDGAYTGDTSGRNIRNVWSIPTAPFPGAHFATFPPEIPLRCIRAGTSLKGVCPECGGPWVREVERGAPPPKMDHRGGNRAQGSAYDGSGSVRHSNGQEHAAWREKNPHKTVGWRPSCECERDPVPATVLDPFFGAGTTGLVAIREGRRAIGIELNPEYAEMAERRIRDECSLLIACGGPA